MILFSGTIIHSLKEAEMKGQRIMEQLITDNDKELKNSIGEPSSIEPLKLKDSIPTGPH
jgi:hypothetical protein